MKKGTKIKDWKKKNGVEFRKVSHKVDISPMTLQRIETGKGSPSIVFGTANNLNKSIHSFLEEMGTQNLTILIKRKNQFSMSSSTLKIKIIGPQNMIADNIVVTYGEFKKGGPVDPHTNPGKEFSYIIERKCKVNQNNKTIISEAGGSIFHNARIEHSITAVEKLKFFSIFIKDKE